MTSISEDMVFVPAGGFIMGSNNDYHDNDFDEKPQHLVDLPAFYISKYPVTNFRYKKFMEATGHNPPEHWGESGIYPEGKENHPVVGINYFDTMAYCKWAGKRLPTEEEWEKAARGTDARRWPWGNTFENTKANVSHRDTSPVDAHKDSPSPYGCYDMAGNVWEWNDTWYELYPKSPENKVVARLLGEKFKVVRGGAYTADIGSARCTDRGVSKPDDVSTSLGFRCAQDAPGYEYYSSTRKILKEAEVFKEEAKLDITPFEEHETSRTLLEESEDLLSKAHSCFKSEDFEESGKLAGKAIEKIRKAHQLALDFTKNKHDEKTASIKKLQEKLEMILKQIPADLPPQKLAMKKKAEEHLEKSRQFFEEGSWGYAEMNVYIGLKMAGGVTGQSGRPSSTRGKPE